MREMKFRAWDKEYKKIKLLTPEGFAVCCGYPEQFILMQFTGLKDKNGKGIFEGDVLISDRYGGRFLVKWSNFNTGFSPFNWPNNVPDNKGCEVIGNIYENPELLEDGK